MSTEKPTWPYAALLVEILLCYRKVLFRPGRYAIPWDLQFYHRPLAEFMAKSFREGHLPLWDPYTYCGWPIYAELTAQVFYPPTIIAVLASNLTGGRHLLQFIELQLIAHVLLGGVFAYILLRRLGTGAVAATIGASVYQLGPFFASQAQHLGAIDAAAWLPLCWLAVVDLSERFTWRWVAVLAMSLAMAILSGFPAVTAVVFISCGLLACVLLSWRSVVGLAVGSVWAIALAAIQVLPTAELTELSVAKYRGDWLGDGGGHPLESLFSLVIPNYWGIFQFDGGTYKLPWNPTFLYLYVGLIGLAFVIVAMFGWRNRYALSFLVLTVACLFWILGQNTPVGLTIFHLLPIIVKRPLYAEFALPAFALGMATLAGLGAQRLLPSRRLGIQYAVVAACAIDLIAVGSSRPMNTTSFANEPGIAYDHYDGVKEIPVKMRELVNQTVPPARIDTMNGNINWSGASALLEVPTASGNDPMAPERVMQARLLFGKGERWERRYEVSSLDSPFVDLLNIRYVVSNNPIAPELLEKARFREAAVLTGNVVYENTEVMPRFFLVTRVRKAAGMAEAAAAVRAADFNPRVEAVVEGDVAVAPSVVQGTVRTLRYDSLDVELEVESPTPVYLVTSETNYSGWRAYVDGVPKPIFTTNIAFRGLAVPAGRHLVTMRFRPAILYRGAAISMIAWAGLAALLLRHWARSRLTRRIAPIRTA